MTARTTPPVEPLTQALAVALADHTSDFVGVVDETGRALFLNRSVRGALPDEVEGKLLEEFLSPERARGMRRMLQEARTTARAVVDEAVRIDALDGSERWFTEKCVPYEESDGTRRYLLVRTEQTHLRRATEELKLSEARYRTLFESNPDPVFVVAAESLAIVAANPAAVRLYGFSAEELCGCDWASLFHESERAAVRDHFLTADAGERRHTAKQRRRDGTDIVADIVDNPVVFNGVSARIAVVRDRTERELVELQLRHAQKMEAMTVFAGGIAHDFNNLLGVISACAQAIREVVPNDDAGASEDLGSLEDAVVRGANLTKKLMLFCRRLATAPAPLDIVRIIDELDVVLRRLLGDGVDLRVVHHTKSATVFGDRTELEQLLSNLVLNAGQAGSRRVDVRTASVDVGPNGVRLPGARPGPYLELTVDDDGQGIDEPTLQRIFEPFFTTKPSGTGLGLAVVHGVVERHHGQLRARSKPGEGTSISVYLPLSPVAVLARDSERTRRRILFADDDDDLRRLTERMLRRLGYDVVSTKDGEEAVQVFAESPDSFDAVVLDVIMPRLRGTEAFAQMRAIRPDLAGLFVSGYVGETGDLGGAGSPSLLHKPFTSDQLAEALRRLPAATPRTADARPDVVRRRG